MCAAILPISTCAASSRPAWRESSRPCGTCSASCSAKTCAATIPRRSCPGRSAAARLPKVLSIADVDRLLTQAKSAAAVPGLSATQHIRALRLACLLEVLYATGLRVSELVTLPLSAARRDARMIVVRGKGNKERFVPLNDAAKQAMADYLAAMDAARDEPKDSKDCDSQAGQMAVSLVRRKRASDAPAFCARAEGACGRSGHRAAAHQPARAAARVRQPPAAQWR